MSYPLVWIIIGASGSGKTTIGRLLAERLECDFIEGDRRHPPENIAKMAAGAPLTGADRAAWLDELRGEITRAVAANRELVLSCSALKHEYRAKLAKVGRVWFVWPEIASSILHQRMAARTGSYMAPAMLESQLAAFEPPSDDEAWRAEGSQSPNAIVDEVVARARLQWPQLKTAWWRR